MNNKAGKSRIIINIVERNQPSYESINQYNKQLWKLFEQHNLKK